MKRDVFNKPVQLDTKEFAIRVVRNVEVFRDSTHRQLLAQGIACKILVFALTIFCDVNLMYL